MNRLRTTTKNTGTKNTASAVPVTMPPITPVPMARWLAEPAPDALAWAQAARASLDRAAAVMVGDVSWVLLRLEERLAEGRKLEPSQEHRTWSLLRFVLSPTFLELRSQLGMAAR